MTELTCGSCRNSPATHLIVADLSGRKSFRVERLTCKPCADSSSRQVRPGDHVRLYRLVPDEDSGDGPAETEWGIRYPVGHPEERVRNFGAGDGEQAARLLLPDHKQVYRGKAALVYREIGPWILADDPATRETEQGNG